jgi:hypothetical protein
MGRSYNTSWNRDASWSNNTSWSGDAKKTFDANAIAREGMLVEVVR